jgi:ribonuclease HI
MPSTSPPETPEKERPAVQRALSRVETKKHSDRNATSAPCQGGDIRPKVTIACDGGCKPNPGRGAWSAVIITDSGEREISGYEPSTTCNRAELLGAINGLEALSAPSLVTVLTDSRYLRDGVTKWIPLWRKRNWRTHSGTAVANRDLWERLVAASRRHQVRWEWLKGHAGHDLNERADRLCQVQIRRAGRAA